MRVLSGAVLLASALAAPAHALQTPQPAGGDPHVQTVPYDPAEEVLFRCTMNRACVLVFAPDERLKFAVMGTAENGPFVPPDIKGDGGSLGNTIPLFPVKPGESNMVITMQRGDGSERPYLFKTVIHPEPPGGGDDPGAAYGLKFSYPADIAAQRAEVAKAAQAQRAERVAHARLAVDAVAAVQNLKYVAKGRDQDLAPNPISDDGFRTKLRFPANQSVPSIYTVRTEGLSWQQERLACRRPDLSSGGPQTESVAPASVASGLLVVQETAPHFRLRLGQKVLDICNEGYEPVGKNPQTGTVSPDVLREIVAR